MTDMPSNEYTCSMCRQTFDKGWSDDEANAEAVILFGRDGHASDMEIVCDDCWNKMNGRFKFTESVG